MLFVKRCEGKIYSPCFQPGGEEGGSGCVEVPTRASLGYEDLGRLFFFVPNFEFISQDGIHCLKATGFLQIIQTVRKPIRKHRQKGSEERLTAP